MGLSETEWSSTKQNKKKLHTNATIPLTFTTAVQSSGQFDQFKPPQPTPTPTQDILDDNGPKEL